MRILSPTATTKASNSGNLHGYKTTISSTDTIHACVLSHFSRVQLFATLWTIAHQTPLSMGFSGQEEWSGLPCPPPGDLPNLGIEPSSLASVVLITHYGMQVGVSLFPSNWNSPRSFLHFQDLDTSEVYRSVMSLNVPQFGFVWCFLKIGSRLCVFGRNNTEVMLCLFSLHPRRWHRVLTCPITGSIIFDHLIKVEHTFSPFGIQNYFNMMKISHSSSSIYCLFFVFVWMHIFLFV